MRVRGKQNDQCMRSNRVKKLSVRAFVGSQIEEAHRKGTCRSHRHRQTGSGKRVKLFKTIRSRKSRRANACRATRSSQPGRAKVSGAANSSQPGPAKTFRTTKLSKPKLTKIFETAKIEPGAAKSNRPGRAGALEASKSSQSERARAFRSAKIEPAKTPGTNRAPESNQPRRFPTDASQTRRLFTDSPNPEFRRLEGQLEGMANIGRGQN